MLSLSLCSFLGGLSPYRSPLYGWPPSFAVTRSHANQKKNPPRTRAQAVRSYLYVDDVAAAFETVLLKGNVGEIYNIGTQKERSVLSVAADIARHFDAHAADPSKAATFVRDRAFNDRRYFICDKKLLALGWREQVSWEEGLARTIEWYRTVGGKRSYWENGDMDAALAPHPTLQASGLMRGAGPSGEQASLGGGGSSSGGEGSDGGALARVPSFIAGGKAAGAAAAGAGPAVVSLTATAGHC